MKALKFVKSIFLNTPLKVVLFVCEIINSVRKLQQILGNTSWTQKKLGDEDGVYDSMGNKGVNLNVLVRTKQEIKAFKMEERREHAGLRGELAAVTAKYRKASERVDELDSTLGPEHDETIAARLTANDLYDQMEVCKSGPETAKNVTVLNCTGSTE